MLIIQDTYVVRGRDELSFEDGYREASDDRLAFFAWAPHGAGEGYEAVALTLVPDVAAWARRQEDIADGELADQRRALEAQLYTRSSTAWVLADWSPLATRTFEAASDVDHAPTLFVLHTFVLDGATRDAMGELDTQRTAAREDDLLQTEACFVPLLGDLATPVVTTLSRVTSTEGLKAALAVADPSQPWTGTPRLSGVRQHKAQLVRTVSWSPVR